MYKNHPMICSSALTFVLALSGCGNKEEVKNPPKDAPKENNSNQAELKDGEVTKQIIDKFNLDEDFTAFDLEVQFEDGSEKEYKINP